MLTPNGGVFGRNPKFNNVTVDGNLTVNGDIALGDDITINDTLTVNGAAQFNGGVIARPNSSAPTSNTVIGNGAGAAMQSGAAENVCIGNACGDALTTGDRNVGVGNGALGAQTTASDIVAIGNNALLRNLTGSQTVAIGSGALDSQTLGFSNVGIGNNALGIASTAINAFTTTPVAGGTGYTANQTGVTVTLIKKSGADTFAGTVQAALTTDASGIVTAVAATPVSAGREFTGTNVIFEPSGFGGGSGCEISIASLTSLNQCVAIGTSSLNAAVTGSNAVAIGFNALLAATNANNNVGVGSAALQACTSASSNTAVGTSALISNQTGSFNTAVGGSAAGFATNANNCAFGFRALQGISGSNGGQFNCAFGVDSLYSAAGCSNTIAFGTSAFVSLATGSGSVAIGHDVARRRGSGTDTLTSATDSIFIGRDARAAANGESNQTVIGGASAVGDGSNTTVINNSSVTSTRIAGTATSLFRIDGDTMRITGTRTPASNAAGTAGDFCFGTDGGVTYLYYCIANANWGRVALTTGY